LCFPRLYAPKSLPPLLPSMMVMPVCSPTRFSSQFPEYMFADRFPSLLLLQSSSSSFLPRNMRPHFSGSPPYPLKNRDADKCCSPPFPPLKTCLFLAHFLNFVLDLNGNFHPVRKEPGSGPLVRGLAPFFLFSVFLYFPLSPFPTSFLPKSNRKNLPPCESRPPR